MHETLLILHNATRWLVLVSLIYSIYRAINGLITKSSFTKKDNSLRHWTATIAHIQMVIGITLYTKSAIVKNYWNSDQEVDFDITFFGIIHIIMMLSAIIIVTIGSSLAKRKEKDLEKFKTMLIWFSIALVIILIAIPWPFSPFANRPYFR